MAITARTISVTLSLVIFYLFGLAILFLVMFGFVSPGWSQTPPAQQGTYRSSTATDKAKIKDQAKVPAKYA